MTDSRERLDEGIAIHIFSVSAAMVGVCLTVIGIIRIVITLRKVETFTDDLLSLDALFFLISCVTSYVAMHAPAQSRMLRTERFADYVFIAALVLMAIVCVLVAYSLI